MPVNIVIDLAMLVAMALVSISGFILEVVIPSRHAVRMHGADSWCSHLCALGRQDVYKRQTLIRASLTRELIEIQDIYTAPVCHVRFL